MELIDLTELNQKLVDNFGKFDDKPKYRVVWSEDQYEKRLIDYTPEGFHLLTPEVREVPKYKQWIHERYVLERLAEVTGETDLVFALSYEPLWVFQDKDGFPLPPIWSACKFIIEETNRNVEHSGEYTKYPDKTETVEEKEAKIRELELSLFGNETTVGDALAQKSAIVVPGKIN